MIQNTDIVRTKQSGVRTMIRFSSRLPRTIIIAVIHLYQKTLSPDHGYFKRYYPGGYCRYQPTCSQYGVMAIEKHGAVAGSFKAVYRIMRCNPWSKGGLDLP